MKLNENHEEVQKLFKLFPTITPEIVDRASKESGIDDIPDEAFDSIDLVVTETYAVITINEQKIKIGMTNSDINVSALGCHHGHESIYSAVVHCMKIAKRLAQKEQ